MAKQFLGIGAQKAGTSWLYRWMSTHPQVHFPLGKEGHYWDKFPDADGSYWRSALQAQEQGHIYGEITPAYAMLDVPTIERIARIFPDLRLFYSLRNPIERSWAQVRMVFHRHDVSLSDRETVLAFVDSRRCRARNDYIGTLERWRRIFGHDALHVILFDDILRRPQQVLSALLDHLHLDGWWAQRHPQEQLQAKVFAGSPDPLPDYLRSHLLAAYRADICLLERDLDRDLSHWLQPSQIGEAHD